MKLEDLVSTISEFATWTQADRIRFFGWYLHTHKQLRRFGTGDLRECYRELHLEDPDSFSPFFKGMKGKLLEDSEGYYLERSVREDLNVRFLRNESAVRVSNLLATLPAKVADADERKFIEEAVKCLKVEARRAAIVLGWCAVIERLRNFIEATGFDAFNQASTKLKSDNTGKFKWWNKGVQVGNRNDLLRIFDTDLLVVLEGMGTIDGNEGKRLGTMFDWRCQCAHPASTPIGDPHVEVFFSDAVEIVLGSPRFHLK